MSKSAKGGKNSRGGPGKTLFFMTFFGNSDSDPAGEMQI